MKANELRTGNLISENYSDDTFVVVNINSEGFTYVDLRNINYKAIGRYSIDSVKPIPLTEERLLSFGAEKFEFDNGQPNQYRIDTELYVIRDGVITDYGTSVKLPYVHTLQNLYFAKKGEELTLQEL